MRKVAKVSVSLDAEDLKWLRRRARRSGRTLSAVFSEAARLMRQVEAREELVRELGDAARLTDAERTAIDAEWKA
ncbi:MAG: hypothetical protein AB2A00_25810 [Myxococcota bacterium]